MCYQPLYDQSFEQAAKEWRDAYAAWERGERPSYWDDEDRAENRQFWEWYGEPPNREFYRPEWKEGEATWFQVYQTVSEGTPVSPPFATQEELIEYLVTYGDFWAQRRGEGGVSREAATAFVMGAGFVPSLVVQDGRVTQGIEIAALDKAEAK